MGPAANHRDLAAWRSRFEPLAGPGRGYDLREVDLLAASPVLDALPAGPGERHGVLRALARDAVVYGLPAALQYGNLWRTVLAPEADGAFDTWQHDRELATPGYAKFRTPNVDTLYSTAWLDLGRGPVEIHVPAFGDRYYTVNLLDAHSNAVNLSTRTLGPGGGRVWLVPPGWRGAVPPGVRRLRVSTPYQWVLMRIFVRSGTDLPAVRDLQDRVLLLPRRDEPIGPGTDHGPWPAAPDDDRLDGASVLVALDQVLRRNGHPVQEEALLARFRALGVGGPAPLRPERWSADTRRAIEAGHADAMALVGSVVARRGLPAGDTGWRILSSGAYGYNYLHRAATNHVGLGGTTRDESGPYTALVDAKGRPLDGRDGPYRLRFRPPPVDAFWSLTVYDRRTRGLVVNAADRHVLNTLTEGVRQGADGSIDVHLGTAAGPDGTSWLPVPSAPFYVVLRAYLGRSEVVDGTWIPAPVERLAEGGT